MKVAKSRQDFSFKIMLVDDDANAQILFAESISDLNCGLQIFNSGFSALFHLKHLGRQELPHLIVLNCRMPGMSGLDVLMRLKLKDSLYHIPVIVYSDQMNNHLAAKLKEYGAAQCYDKIGERRAMKEYLKILEVVFRNSVFENTIISQ